MDRDGVHSVSLELGDPLDELEARSSRTPSGRGAVVVLEMAGTIVARGARLACSVSAAPRPSDRFTRRKAVETATKVYTHALRKSFEQIRKAVG
jgi:hypothetical protein